MQKTHCCLIRVSFSLSPTLIWTPCSTKQYLNLGGWQGRSAEQLYTYHRIGHGWTTVSNSHVTPPSTYPPTLTVNIILLGPDVSMRTSVEVGTHDFGFGEWQGTLALWDQSGSQSPYPSPLLLLSSTHQPLRDGLFPLSVCQQFSFLAKSHNERKQPVCESIWVVLCVHD